MNGSSGGSIEGSATSESRWRTWRRRSPSIVISSGSNSSRNGSETSPTSRSSSAIRVSSSTWPSFASRARKLPGDPRVSKRGAPRGRSWHSQSRARLHLCVYWMTSKRCTSASPPAAPGLSPRSSLRRRAEQGREGGLHARSRRDRVELLETVLTLAGEPQKRFRER